MGPSLYKIESGSSIDCKLSVFGERPSEIGHHGNVRRDVNTWDKIGQCLKPDVQSRDKVEPQLLPADTVFDLLRDCGFRAVLWPEFSADPPGVPAGQPGCFGSSGLALRISLRSVPAHLMSMSSTSMISRADRSGRSGMRKCTAAIRAKHGSLAFNAAATVASPDISRSAATFFR